MENIFISFPLDEVSIATYLAQQLKKFCRDDDEISIYPENVDGKNHWLQQIKNEIENCTVFIFIVGDQVNSGQFEELQIAVINNKNIWRICTKAGSNVWSETLDKIKAKTNKVIKETNFEKWDRDQNLDLDGTISKIFSSGNIIWKYEKYRNDGLPLNSQIFNYEKDIIEYYYNYNSYIIRDKNEKTFETVKNKILQGVPAEWPILKPRTRRPKMEPETLPDSVQEEIGNFREPTNYVLSAALSGYHTDIKRCPCNSSNKLIFPEAGPRKEVFKIKTKNFRVGILVSGGIAPGINAVIDGITRRQYFYAKKLGYANSLTILGLINGFDSLRQGDEIDSVLLCPTEADIKPGHRSIVTSNITNEGGSIIGTSRYQPLVDNNFTNRLDELKDIVTRLRLDGIRILYIIGGEGSMKAAQAIQEIADIEKTNKWDLNVVGIPKTMDNDILWVWQTFGFMSAVEKAREFIEYLYVESKSNPRWGIVQLFGSNSGFVVSHAVLACKSDICNLAIIPEMKYNLRNVIEYIIANENENGIIVLAETAVPSDIDDYLKKKEVKEILTPAEKNAIKELGAGKKKIDLHVNDDLRSGVVKVIAWAVVNEAKKRVFINEPRHLLRSIPPSTIDIITASRLGTLAVDNAMAGFYGFMISQWLTEFCLVPLELVVLGRKRIPPEGIFFKSVIKKTGQPQKLD
jgi:6-phosphofructokinase 1